MQKIKRQQTRILFFFGLFLIFSTFLFNSSCQRGGGGRGPVTAPTGAFPTTPPDFFPTVPGPGPLPTQSGGIPPVTVSSLSPAEKQALLNAVNAANEVGQYDPTLDLLSPALKAEAMRLLQEEAAGKDVAVQKIMLAGKMMQECANRIAMYAPIPGQPLLGTWNGQGSCSVTFTVSGSGQATGTGTAGNQNNAGKYSVSGGTQGTMQADQSGRGAITAKEFSGNLSDTGQGGKSGSGTMTHPTFFKRKSGTAPCNVNVVLTSSANPIPQNYQLGMKLAGRCFRQTLILMSPAMDQTLKSMDPALGQLLYQRFLGISK